MKRIGQSKELTPRMKQVVQFMFDNPSMNQEQIGKAIGISGQRVSQIIRSGRVLEAFPVLARARIKGMVPKAIKRYGELLDQKTNLEVSRKVTERILDTNKVLEPETKIQVNVYAQLPTQDLENIVCNARKTPKSVSDAIEAEIVAPEDDQPK